MVNNNKVTKNPKAQERGKKAWQTTLEKIKTKHIAEIKNGAGDTGTPTPTTGTPTPTTGTLTPTSTGSTITIDTILLLGIGVAAYFYMYQKPSQEPEKPKAAPEPPVKNQVFWE